MVVGCCFSESYCSWPSPPSSPLILPPLLSPLPFLILMVLLSIQCSLPFHSHITETFLNGVIKCRSYEATPLDITSLTQNVLKNTLNSMFETPTTARNLDSVIKKNMKNNYIGDTWGHHQLQRWLCLQIALCNSLPSRRYVFAAKGVGFSSSSGVNFPPRSPLLLLLR